MDPNELNNLPNSELGSIQPLGQPFDQSAQPMQPMEHQMQPLQPIDQSINQPLQPMGQPIQQPMDPAKSQKPKPNFVLIGIIAGALVLLAVVGIVVALSMSGGNKSKPPEPMPNPVADDVVPTPELAKSVCKEHNGIFDEPEMEMTTYQPLDIVSVSSCQYYRNAQETDGGYYVSTYVTGDFDYQINFIKEDKKEDYWRKAKAGFKEITDSNMKVLKDSGEMIGYYGSTLVDAQDGQGIRAYVYTLLYEDASIVLRTYGQDNSLAKDLLEELGFPDPEEINNSGNNTSNDPAAEGRDAQRRNDYSMIITSVNSYMASNSGKISNMVKDADPHTLTASRWINESGNDPNEKPYELKAYSWNAWNNAPLTPFGSDGSQVFIVINANCKGVDANGNPAPAKDKAVRSFAVYGYLENGVFCQDSGSAE